MAGGLEGCGGSTPSRSAHGSTGSTTRATVTASEAAPAGCPSSTSSSTAYDPAGGTYATYLTGVDTTRRTVTFDVIEFLTGADARRVFQQAHPGATGPPNDYWIVDSPGRVYTAPVSAGVQVHLVGYGANGVMSVSGGFQALPAHLRSQRPIDAGDRRLSLEPYWLTLRHGSVETICEQFTP